mgnify:CR=1 FL=1
MTSDLHSRVNAFTTNTGITIKDFINKVIVNELKHEHINKKNRRDICVSLLFFYYSRIVQFTRYLFTKTNTFDMRADINTCHISSMIPFRFVRHIVRYHLSINT